MKTLLITFLMTGAFAHADKDCTSNYKEASAHFQSVLGTDASIDRIPSFAGTIKASGMTLPTKNSIVKAGEQVYLNIVVLGKTVSVPAKVCKKGGVLQAALIMSSGVVKDGKGGETQLSKQAPGLPKEIVLTIKREENNKVAFKNETYPKEAPVSVSLSAQATK